MLNHPLLILVAASAAVGGAAPARAEPASSAELAAVYTLDGWSNLHGGQKKGSVLLNSAQVGVEVDADRTLGWRGASFNISAIYNDRRTVSGDLTDDLHGIDNKDAAGGVRLFEAWVRQTVPGGYAKVGKIDLNAEFNVNGTGALFINGAHGLGLDLGQAGWSGPSVYPRTNLGLVAALEGRAVWKVGAFSGTSPPDAPRRQGLAGKPVLALAEMARETGTGGRVTLGVWGHSAGYGDAFGDLGRQAAGGGYLLVEHPLWRNGVRGLDGFVRVGVADPKAHALASEINLGLVMTSPFLGVEGEAAGLALLSARTSARFRRLPGEPPRGRRETVIEATWRVPIARGVTVQPDVQYVVRPGALKSARNALVVGLRLEAAWRRGF